MGIRKRMLFLLIIIMTVAILILFIFFLFISYMVSNRLESSLNNVVQKIGQKYLEEDRKFVYDKFKCSGKNSFVCKSKYLIFGDIEINDIEVSIADIKKDYLKFNITSQIKNYPIDNLYNRPKIAIVLNLLTPDKISCHGYAGLLESEGNIGVDYKCKLGNSDSRISFDGELVLDGIGDKNKNIIYSIIDMINLKGVMDIEIKNAKASLKSNSFLLRIENLLSDSEKKWEISKEDFLRDFRAELAFGQILLGILKGKNSQSEGLKDVDDFMKSTNFLDVATRFVNGDTREIELIIEPKDGERLYLIKQEDSKKHTPLGGMLELIKNRKILIKENGAINEK